MVSVLYLAVLSAEAFPENGRVRQRREHRSWVLLRREDDRPQVQLLEDEAFHGTGGGCVRVC